MAEHDRPDELLTAEIRELFALMKDSDIAEVKIERGDAKVHIKRTTAQPPAPTIMPMYSAPQSLAVAPQIAAPVPMVGATPSPVVEEAAQEQTPGVTVTAPMVGTYYGSPSPKEPPYVQIGDEVKPGDVLGIIEAMKIMNEIECEVHGRVAKIMVENAQPIEYGQPLMIIEPL